LQKAPDAFRTISEVADDLDVPQHVLRFWETRFTQIKPMKRSGGRRYYRPDDVALLRGIRHLLYGEGYTIRGVQRILREQGIKSLQRLAGVPDVESGVAATRIADDHAAEELDFEADGGDIEDDDLPDVPVAKPAKGVATPPVDSNKPASALPAESRKPPMRAEELRRLRAALDDLTECRTMLADALKAEPDAKRSV
jgi:DNA-binding transcriptional MerR regulator